jgi:hypothetical protein
MRDSPHEWLQDVNVFEKIYYVFENSSGVSQAGFRLRLSTPIRKYGDVFLAVVSVMSPGLFNALN